MISITGGSEYTDEIYRRKFRLINDAAKDGNRQLLANPDTGDYWAAQWHNDMWIYPFSKGFNIAIQIEGCPTHYMVKD